MLDFNKFSIKNNYIDILDNIKKNLDGAVVKHDIYNKITFNDTLLDEINSIIIPIISKINNTLGTRYNKEYIDYKHIEKKIDKSNNIVYQIILVLFQKGSTQKELTFEIFKDAQGEININKVIDQSNIYKLNFEDTYNSSNIYMNDGTHTVPTVPQCSQSYPSNTVGISDKDIGTNGIEHFGSRTRDFDDANSQNMINKNIEKISKYYNLTNQFEYPNLQNLKGLFDRTSIETDTLEGTSKTKLPFSEINFKVNSYGIQEASAARNAWLVDKEKEKGITKVYPNNKLSNKWDTTGTTIPISTKESDIADGIDYACEIREKIPRYHPSSFAYYANNDFKNISNGSNMFSLLHNGGAGHTPI